jgi:hypothetical protein
MGVRRGNNPRYETQHRIFEAREGLSNALKNTEAYSEDDSSRIFVIEEILNFNQETGEIMDYFRVRWLKEESKYQAIVQGKDILPDEPLTSREYQEVLTHRFQTIEKFGRENIRRFGMEGLMCDRAILFDTTSSTLTDDTSLHSL